MINVGVAQAHPVIAYLSVGIIYSPGLIITSGHQTFVMSISFIDRSYVAVTGHYVLTKGLYELVTIYHIRALVVRN